MIAQNPIYSFESGGVTNQECLNLWSQAGSKTYKQTIEPNVVLNAVTDLNLKNDAGSDNSIIFKDQLEALKKQAPNKLIVIYFPTGTYFFTQTINLSPESYTLSNLIIKGESASNTKIYFNHTGTGISIGMDASKIGIEDITLEAKNGASGDTYNVLFNAASDSWLSGVISKNAYKAHVCLTELSENITINGCVFDEAQEYGKGGEGYGVLFSGGYNCLLENCQFGLLRHSIILQREPTFNVISYNASFQPYAFELFNPGLVAPPDLSFHGWYTKPNDIQNNYGAHHNLIEGNRIGQIKFDKSHGSNGPYNTFLRNKIITSFDISKCIFNTCSNGYSFNEYNQVHQNVIGCSGISELDQNEIKGDVIFCDSDGEDAYYNINDNEKSYYTWNQKPEYLSNDSWPFKPESSFNGAEERLLYNFNGYWYTYYYNEQPEGWKNYFCGPMVGKYLLFDNNRQISEGEYKASSRIQAISCKIKYDGPVNFTAGDEITLEPGFETELGADFTASIDPNICESGKQMIADLNTFPKIFPEPVNINKKSTNSHLSSQGIHVEGFKDELLNIYPNPFTNDVVINFSLAEGSTTNIIVYNNLMQPVAIFSKVYPTGGNYEINQSLNNLPPGIYTLGFATDAYQISKRIVKAF